MTALAPKTVETNSVENMASANTACESIHIIPSVIQPNGNLGTTHLGSPARLTASLSFRFQPSSSSSSGTRPVEGAMSIGRKMAVANETAALKKRAREPARVELS